ncbi:hypothetical protein EDD11_009967 [Mortierella claussenii]|nr:hypothetical protein EDD11_009967 [Mortierella claussenii]
MVPDRAVGALPSSFSSSEPAGSMFTFASASAQARASPSFNVLSARGTPKGPLPIDVQLNLLTSVLKHDPFNCPIRQTSQVWERIGREQGIRARTCARRYENIIQANIAGRDRPVGTEEQMAAKEQLLEQLFVMMNQPQAIVRMQKKRRYRSEEADRKLLMETIRLNPFGQKIGQVAKAWEDVKDTLGMKVHARQCIRRVNRMVKPYQLRERMYNGNIPEEMKEENDDLVKQVMLLMQLGGHGGVLEDDAGPSNEDDSISDSDYQENSYMASELSKRNLIQESDELKGDHDKDMASPPASSSHAEITGVQSPLIQQSTPAASEPASMRSSGTTTPIKKSRSHTRNSSGLTDKKKSSNGAGGAEDSRAVRSVESEFRPQRIWGSHPYSRETLSRAALGPQLQRGRPNKKNEQRLSVNSAGDYQQPVKYTRSSVGGRVESFIEPDHDNQQILVQSPVSDASYHISLPSPLALSIASSSKSVHEAGPFPLDSASHLYQTLLNEFHVVKGYLSRLDGQRQRDKDNQRKMYSMVEKLQLHVTEQQRSIQDLQIQMQQSYQQRHSPNQPSTSSLQQDVSWTQQSYQQQQQYQLHRHHHECSPSAQIQPENPRSSERHHTVPSTRPLLPLWPDHEYGQGSNSRGDDDRSLQDRISAVSNVMYESQAGVKTTMISSENSDSE